MTTALAVSAGAQHTCATTTGGGVMCWGNGGNGRLGNGSTSNSSVPVQVQSVSGTPLVVSTSTVVATGDDFSCVTGVGSLGQLACWGNNALGTLGDGTTTSSTRAKLVPGAFGASWVAAGDAHACAILTGQAFCWGVNSDGRLGDGTLVSHSTPKPVSVSECD
jgi:alpha-tubulin suppressor-like RCC1 family protein